jgi:glycosyltransferase involved in cell wall biosynthesis
MRWLIIEDSLEGRQGHWFEYLENFCRELPRLGDEVTLLVSRRAEPFIQSQLGALPVLPESAFGKMSDGAPAWRRYARIPVHAWKTFWAVRRHLRAAPEPDVIFVPTVIVHHLLAWTVLIKLGLKRKKTRVLLFFPGLPIRRADYRTPDEGQQTTGRQDDRTTGPLTTEAESPLSSLPSPLSHSPAPGPVVLDGSPTSKLVRTLLRWLAPEIRAGKVILGVETQPMKRAADQVFQVPFTYFPHPVAPLPYPRPHTPDEGQPTTGRPDDGATETPSPLSPLLSPLSQPSLTLAGYGAARHEKGSDVLVAALEKYLAQFPQGRSRFVVQWLEDFATTSGATARLPASLRQHARVEVVSRLFADGEYAQRLAATQALLLPYRCSSYALRVSRVVIEAVVNGLPVVATRGTTLAEQAEQFGAAILCDDGGVESLAAAIGELERNCKSLAVQARGRRVAAREHFSVRHFRSILAKGASNLGGQ